MQKRQTVKTPVNIANVLGVSKFHDQTTLIYQTQKPGHQKLTVATSEDGLNFKEHHNHPVILSPSGQVEDLARSRNFRLTSIAQQELVSYIKDPDGSGIGDLTLATPVDELWDIATWNNVELKKPIKANSAHIVPEHKSDGDFVMYFSDDEGVKLATAKNIHNWQVRKRPLLALRPGYFDNSSIEVIATHYYEQGTIIIYTNKSKRRFKEVTAVGMAFIAHDNPTKVLWRSDEAVWKITGKQGGIRILGANVRDENITLYIHDANKGFYTVDITNPFVIYKTVEQNISLDKHDGNPVMTPDNKQAWEALGTFNPAVMIGRDDRVHMLYRAIGEDGISRLGYASSQDGFTFDDNLPYPVYTMPKSSRDISEQQYNPIANPSGGSWSGTEDPRMVSIEGQVYVTFNAFDGWNFIRASAVKISEDDLLRKRFAWSNPLYLSPQGEIHKNWVLFPEKINNKFAILHSISPEVQVDYVESLEDLHKGRQRIKSRFGQKQPRKTWDSWLRGAGPPPIKTDKGWLVLYHATDKRYPHQYRLGAKLLSLNNPSKIIARSAAPILVPDRWYENHSKPGVVYACGAIIKDNQLLVYYGGGDRHVCIASAPIDQFLEELLTERKPHLNFNEITIS